MADQTHTRPPKALIAVALLLVIGLIGWWWWSSSTAAADGEAIATGAVEARDYQVASVLAGRVVKVEATEGDTVSKGQVLVRLDDAALKLQVDQANQGVRAARAQLKNERNDGSRADIEAAKARLKQAEAAVKLAKVQRAYATIKAPHDGIVVAVTTNVGQNSAPGKTLVTITDPKDLFVRVFVPETRIGSVKVGQIARAAIDSASDTFEGKVSYIASQSEFTPNNVETKEQRVKLVYEVRVDIDDPSGALKAGLPVDVTFE